MPKSNLALHGGQKAKTVPYGTGNRFGAEEPEQLCPKYGAPDKHYVYGRGLCTTAERILETSVRLSVSEFYTETDLAETIEAVQKVCRHYR